MAGGGGGAGGWRGGGVKERGYVGANCWLGHHMSSMATRSHVHFSG
jgi:hypothetical protein